MEFAMLAAGLVIGVVCTVLIFRSRLAQAEAAGRSDCESERATLAERVQNREMELSELRTQMSQHVADVSELQREAVTLKTQLEAERKQAAEKLAVVEQAQVKLSDVFKALAADALNSNNQSFLQLAKSSLEKFQEAAKGDLDKRQQAIGQLVQPVTESLEKVDAKIQRMEKERVGAYEGLTQQVRSLLDSQKDLRQETSNLVKALRTPSVQGRWGEIQLKRVVELAGMQEHCDFYEQQTANTENGQLRPDLLVRLPGEKHIVVDAKAPLHGYLEAISATDDESRAAHLKDHARQVRTHLTALSRKSYFEQFEPAPEFVVLFLPGEVFFSAAVQHDPTLIETGALEKVIIATPTTLIALLRAVFYGWKQEVIAQNAREISELGRDLYRRLKTVGEHIANLGKHLANATGAYNKTVGSLESRVLVTARKFEELGVGKEDIEPLEPVDQTCRNLDAPEFRQTTLELVAD